ARPQIPRRHASRFRNGRGHRRRTVEIHARSTRANPGETCECGRPSSSRSIRISPASSPMTGSRILFRLLPFLALGGVVAVLVSLRLEHKRLLTQRDALRTQSMPAPPVATTAPPRGTSRPPEADDAAAIARLRDEVDRLRKQIAQRER